MPSICALVGLHRQFEDIYARRYIVSVDGAAIPQGREFSTGVHRVFDGIHAPTGQVVDIECYGCQGREIDQCVVELHYVVYAVAIGSENRGGYFQ